MKPNGWILVHKRIWESENWNLKKNKSKIILIWIWLLTHCDENGEVTFGRFQIAKDTGLSDSSVKRAIEHIRDKMKDEVTYKATSHYTRILVINWHKYQRKATKLPTSYRPASDQQVTTNKEIKNKRIKESNIVETQRVYDLYLSSFEKNGNIFKLTPPRKTKIKARLNDAGIEMIEKAILNTSKSPFHRGDNDRGWQANLDYILRSYEKTEELSQLKPKFVKSSDGQMVEDNELSREREEYIKKIKERTK